jgi:hypothetical protein
LARARALDDDGSQLDDDSTEVFCNLPKTPPGWNDPESKLEFKMSPKEQDFLRRRLTLLTRAGETAQSLLARLVEARDSYPGKEHVLPRELKIRADITDKQALDIAMDAAGLAAIGRAVYGALVEHLRTVDGGPDEKTFRTQLHSHFDVYAGAASRCDLVGLERPENFLSLRACYQHSEVMRKTSSRARLSDTIRSAQRRSEWEPGRHNTTPLHYRWHVVREMLNDLSGPL